MVNERLKKAVFSIIRQALYPTPDPKNAQPSPEAVKYWKALEACRYGESSKPQPKIVSGAGTGAVPKFAYDPDTGEQITRWPMGGRI